MSLRERVLKEEINIQRKPSIKEGFLFSIYKYKNGLFGQTVVVDNKIDVFISTAAKVNQY